MKKLSKSYNPSEFEDKIYKLWLDKNAFRAEVNHAKKPYTIVIPPPNITGQLHMGHALDETLQDVIIRHKRMQGYATLWLPGTDHASIATEVKIVDEMKKNGISKDDIGRDGFLERAWAWKKKYGGRIVEQLKKLGSSCDWSRERFTMDEGCNRAVVEVFVNLYEKNLIYRGERIINLCPTCLTSISDAEVEFEEQDGNFWHLRYPLTDGSGELLLATTRPETLLGDTAVAVNPKDERYIKYIGKTVTLPLVGREIPVIADDYVDMDFGTGVVKITPAHDPNDFEVGLRHNLPTINVMTDDAKITEDYSPYNGMERYAARNAIVADLEKQGFLVKIEPHKHNVGTCYRCGTTVEPRLSKQWFVKMKPLAEPAIMAVKNGETKFVPSRFEKTYFHWLENIRDWCVSRQLWWGHRIPAFYCEKCGEITVTKDDYTKCKFCGGETCQDNDTLDTWFSSALWPFSTLGYPEKTEDLSYFYPTNTLVTGYDIIFFWVVRMMFSGLEHMRKIPFDTVLIHGLVRDELGRKMSKSLGNGIDPLEIICNYGADALRFMLATGNSPGNDMRFIPAKVKSAAGFANKLWNASRFVLMNLPENFSFTGLPSSLEIEDKWLISKLNLLVKEVNLNLEKFEIGIASDKIMTFIWDVYCDWYIELTKPRIAVGDCVPQQILVFVMHETLKLLHPFMPFITEEIWQSLTDGKSLLMLEKFPEFNPKLDFSKEENDFSKIVEFIKVIRNTRSEINVPPSVKTKLLVEINENRNLFSSSQMHIKNLAKCAEIDFITESIPNCAVCVTSAIRAFIPLDNLIDKGKELARLTKEMENIQKDIDFLSKKLSNQGFLAKAPKPQVETEQKKLNAAIDKMDKITNSIKKLKNEN